MMFLLRHICLRAMNTAEYNKIYSYLNSDVLPASLKTAHDRFSFKRKCRCYELNPESNSLYYVQKHKDGRIRRRAEVVVGTIENAKAVFDEFHLTKPTPHPGLNRTLQEISKRYFWPRMTYNVINWIRDCPVCVKSKEIEKAKLHQMKISEPWEILTMNIIGPVSETREGYKFIFTAMDFYSKWVEAFPICNKFPAEVAACLKLIFYRHGAWKSVLSSEKLDFVQAVNCELCKQFGGNHHVKAVYHPQVVTLDTLWDKEIENVFLTLVDDHSADWPHYIDGLLFTMRTKKHPATKFTPFYLLHKREARIPSVPESDPISRIDSVFDLNQLGEPNYEATAARDKRAEIQAHAKTIESLREAQVDQLIENALATTEPEKKRQFIVGEKVLMSNCRKRPLDFSTNDTVVTGPYVVTEVTSEKVKIMSLKDFTQVKTVTEVNRLVPYKESYKLSFFEGLTNRPERPRIPQTTFQIITCDPPINDGEIEDFDR